MNRAPEFVTTSMQDVLPPNSIVDGPGLAIDPRVPQKRRFTFSLRSFAEIFQLNTIQIRCQPAERFANPRRVSLHRGHLHRGAEFCKYREAITGAGPPHFMCELPDRFKVVLRKG